MRSAMLVGLQFMLLSLLAWPWGGIFRPVPAIVLFALGIALGVWTLACNRPGNFNIRPELKPGAEFISNGPYAYVRHPMYLSVLLLGFGAVLLYQGWLKLCLWIALFAVLWIKSGIEEKEMRRRFPAYRDYASMVGRFFPKILRD